MQTISQSMAIAYPHTGSIPHVFMHSMREFREYDLAHGNILGAVIPCQGMYIAGQRNKMVRGFLSLPDHVQWMLCVDSDQIFTPEVPYALLQSAQDTDARIMSALYFGILAGRPSPMWWGRNPETGDYHTVSEITEGIQEIAAFGMGMVLIHRSVFEQMAATHNDDPWQWFGHDLVKFQGKIERYGEDICFCERVRQAGIKMYGDSRIVIGHEKKINLDYDAFMALYRLAVEKDPDVTHRIIDPIV